MLRPPRVFLTAMSAGAGATKRDTMPQPPTPPERKPVAEAIDVEHLKRLEQSKLVHVPPTRIADHVCIHTIRFVRFLSDMLMRDKFLHRALLQYLLVGDAALAAQRSHTLRSTVFGVNNYGPLGCETRSNLLYEHAARTALYHAVVDLAGLRFVGALCVAMWRFVLYGLWRFVFLISPRAGHRAVAYAAEENSVIATHFANDLDLGKVIDRSLPRTSPAAEYLLFTFPKRDPPVSTSSAPAGPKRGAVSASPVLKARHAAGATPDAPRAAEAPGADDEGLDEDQSIPLPEPVEGQPSLHDVAIVMRSHELEFAALHHHIADSIEQQKADRHNATPFE